MKKKIKISVSAKIAGFSLIGLLAIGIFWFSSVFFGNRNSLPVLGEPGHRAGAFSFTNQDGKSITNKSVENKVTVAEYFFASCPSICPIMNKNLEEVYEKFKGNPDFVILSHTVDPERDSVPVLNAYANRFNASAPGWEFLTGAKQALYESATQDYLLAAADSGSSQFIHTQYVALLDKSRRIRGFYDMTNAENIDKLDAGIRQLLAEPVH
jgi:protein SCO1/2